MTSVDDIGRIINHMIVEGQIHGGIAQGIGQALYEQVCYDAQGGQLQSGSLMDYGVPRADQMPPMHCALRRRRAVQDQPARGQGLRRAGHHRRRARGGERGARRARRARREAHRDAMYTGESLAGAGDAGIGTGPLRPLALALLASLALHAAGAVRAADPEGIHAGAPRAAAHGAPGQAGARAGQGRSRRSSARSSRRLRRVRLPSRKRRRQLPRLRRWPWRRPRASNRRSRCRRCRAPALPAAAAARPRRSRRASGQRPGSGQRRALPAGADGDRARATSAIRASRRTTTGKAGSSCASRSPRTARSPRSR